MQITRHLYSWIRRSTRSIVSLLLFILLILLLSACELPSLPPLPPAISLTFSIGNTTKEYHCNASNTCNHNYSPTSTPTPVPPTPTPVPTPTPMPTPTPTPTSTPATCLSISGAHTEKITNTKLGLSATIRISFDVVPLNGDCSGSITIDSPLDGWCGHFSANISRSKIKLILTPDDRSRPRLVFDGTIDSDRSISSTSPILGGGKWEIGHL